jgi:hypothetical protein
MKIRYLLALLFGFFRPAIDETPPGGETLPGEGETPPEDPAEPDLDLSGGAEPDEHPQDDPDDKPNPELEAERRARAQEKERADRYEREAAELRTRYSAPPSDEDRIREEEERVLKNPETNDLQKWQIQTNRNLRAQRSESQSALMRAQDLSDQTSFRSICMADTTGMAKRYETRVEQELARVRSNGGNAAREAIYTYLLGKDMREGKFKKKAAAPKKDADSGVNRGRLPGARSDVHGRTGLSEREKRAKRLENLQI